MKKSITLAAAVLLAAIGPVFSGELRTDLAAFDRGFGDIKQLLSCMDVPEASGARPAGGEKKARPVKEWTVMVYMNGKNDLEAAGLLDLDEMERVGSSGQVNIVAEWGRMSGQAGDISGLDGDWTGSRRYYVVNDLAPEKIKSRVLQKLPSVDMGDWRHLADFANWGMKNYPAKRYALIVWNHGSGWKTSKAAVNKGISYDFETKNHISTPELGLAMKAIGKVDVLAFDACLMQMAEVAWEVREQADFIVGSEESVPGLGLPYDYFLGLLSLEGRVMEPEQFSRMMVEGYTAFYASHKSSTTLSVLRTSALPGFSEVLNAWTDAMLASGRDGELKGLFPKTNKYDDTDFKDLYDFARRVEALDEAGPLGRSSRALMAAIDGGVVIKNSAYAGGYYPDRLSRGLSIYLPEAGYDSKYDQLAWAKASRWDEFLKRMREVALPRPADTGACTDPGPGAGL